jgi:uncharacterized membrane protein YhaH (DUF805 family)
MEFELSSFWQWDGRVGRKTYFLAGLIGCAIKFNLDRLTSAILFQKDIRFVEYWEPLGSAARLTRLAPADRNWLALLLLTALPFIYVGLTMTVKRLRDLGYPLWLAALFFVPVGNIIFFAALCLLPSAKADTGADVVPWTPQRGVGDLMPESKLGSALLTVLVSGAIGLLSVALLGSVAGSYGWSLFLSVPFCMGLISAFLYNARAIRGLSETLGVALLSITVVGLAILCVAVEGLICVAMAAPVAYGCAALGGLVGHSALQLARLARDEHRRPTSSLCVAILLLPISGAVERLTHAEPPTYRVQSSIEIDAPPADVWRRVVSFSEIPPPEEMLFRAGIAYPIRAEITGHGVGAVRRCIFSTGPFVEPIEVWDEPRLLRFGVTENPAPLNELSPYGNIRPPHLHGYFVSHEGQFLLTELPGGRTRLEGTTWYTDAIWPAAYWRLWSDYIIHRIHMRVLQHIKGEVETKPVELRGAY